MSAINECLELHDKLQHSQQMQKRHLCTSVQGTIEDTLRNQVERVDENGKIYNSIFTYKEDAPIEKKMSDLFEIRILSEEEECNKYELLTQEFLKINKLVLHRNQQFKEGHRTIEHSCKKENEKLQCSTLIETNILGKPKYRDGKGNKYPSKKLLKQNGTSETEIQESQKKKTEYPPGRKK